MEKECKTCGRPLMPGDTGDYCAEHQAPPQTDLFNEQRLTIKGNPVLEQAACIILLVVERHPEVLDHDTVGQVDRAILAEVLLEEGLLGIMDGSVNSRYPENRFRELMVKTGGARAPESLRRGRQWLVEHDHIRLSAAAIRDATKKQAMIQNAMGGH